MQINKHQKAKLATLDDISVSTGGNQVLAHISLTIHKKEQWAIIGHSGSGKTTLAHVFQGKIFYRGVLTYHFHENIDLNIELVEQQHHFKNLSNTSSFYYQQRFNASEAADSITVADALEGHIDKENWIELLHLDGLLQKPLLQLSNGENKRLQLAKALLAGPNLLILDNPFIGLDIKGRETLHAIFGNICSKGIHIILITNPTELPDCITHVAVLEKGHLISIQKKKDYLLQPVTIKPTVDINTALLQQLQPPAATDFRMAVKMDNVTIRYGEKVVLNNINWQVKKGECWNVEGPNGAGKSTLLSLITADNPQAYANKIILFDKQRGTGESIWDIKKRIGFVSPELHLYFEQHITCFEVIASGLFDTIGLFRRLSAEQEEKILLWMRLMELESFRDKRIYQLSTSQQRMALLARALVKNPPLLILDEPTQGLDEMQTAYFKNLINEICSSFKTTLIYVSHYTSDLPSCINQFLQLDNGIVQ
ncbi:MAG: ATP-binding cassette domain-containing protein [Chitinophagaceae bacterium]